MPRAWVALVSSVLCSDEQSVTDSRSDEQSSTFGLGLERLYKEGSSSESARCVGFRCSEKMGSQLSPFVGHSSFAQQ